MKIIDISWPISQEMTEYKDKKTVTIKQLIKQSSDVRESMLCMKSHTGTHIDAPAHFIKDGKTLDQLPLDATIGPCKVIDLTQVPEKITKKDLEHVNIAKHDIILCKTRNSFLEPTAPFNYNFIYIDSDAAHYLVDFNIKAIGIDYLGIERNQPDHKTHKTFMKYEIPIIEGLRLKDVQPGNYFLWCLPLFIMNVDAAPARALLVSF